MPKRVHDAPSRLVNPSPGMHTLLLVDDKGERLVRKFEVFAKDSGR